MNTYEFEQAIIHLESTCGLTDLRIMDCHENADDTVSNTDTNESRAAWVSVFTATIASYKDMA